jgi:hypothetical protein
MMRRAQPHELIVRAVPLMTACIDEGELTKWFPIHFDLIEDPQETAEPSLGALVALDSGAYVVVYYGKMSGQLTVEIPVTSDPTAMLRAFFDEIPLPASRVLWHRPDVVLPANAQSLRVRHA